MNKETFFTLYGKSTKARERYQKAIRREVPGGNQTLDLLELVNQVRTRGRIDDPIDFLRVIEDRVQEIRSEMVESIKEKYHL